MNFFNNLLIRLRQSTNCMMHHITLKHCYM